MIRRMLSTYFSPALGILGQRTGKDVTIHRRALRAKLRTHLAQTAIRCMGVQVTHIYAETDCPKVPKALILWRHTGFAVFRDQTMVIGAGPLTK